MLLDRRNIIGDVDKNTPKFIIVDMAKAHGIHCRSRYIDDNDYVESVLQAIGNTKVYCFESISYRTTEELSLIARYINNREYNWSVNSLKESYDVMKTAMSKSGICNIIRESLLKYGYDAFGELTNRCPRRISKCILYAYCRHNGYTVGRNTTHHQLVIRVSTSMMSPFILMVASVNSMNKRGDVLMFSNNDKPDKDKILEYVVDIKKNRSRYSIRNNLYVDNNQTSTHVQRNNKHNRFHKGHIATDGLIHHQSQQLQHSHLQSHRKNIPIVTLPRDVNESLVLAVLLYDLDISFADQPLLEFYNLLSSYHDNKTFNIDMYQPYDKAIKKVLNINRHRLIFSQNFNPLFPLVLYSTPIINSIYESYAMKDRGFISNSGRYNILIKYSSTNNFYEGIHPELHTTTTPFIYEDVMEIQPELIVSYGKLYDEMAPFTLDELDSLFNMNGNFVDVIEGVLFTNRAIRKLYYIGIKANHRIVKTIDSIRERIKECNDDVDRMVYFAKSSTDLNSKIVKLLSTLMEVGMYMRGWDGKSVDTYPIIEALVEPSHLNKVYDDIEKSIRQFYESCNNTEKIGKMILKLPLVRWEGNEFRSCKAAGSTINDRLQIVTRGYTAPLTSCIRSSSNWICSSAYCYLQRVGSNVPFDINNLRHIR